MAAYYAAHTTNQNTHLLTAKTPHPKQTRATHFGKWKLREKRSQENGPKAKNGSDKKSNSTRQNKKRGYIEN